MGITKEFINEREAATFLGVSIHKLRQDRFKGAGLPYVKFNRRILYNVAALREAMAAMTINPMES